MVAGDSQSGLVAGGGQSKRGIGRLKLHLFLLLGIGAAGEPCGEGVEEPALLAGLA